MILFFKGIIKHFNLFVKTSVCATLVFYLVGYVLNYKEVTDYGSWAIMFMPVHVIISVVFSIPLTIIFHLIDQKKSQASRSEFIRSSIVKLFVIGAYIFLLLYFVLFREYSKQKDSFNYHRQLYYLTYFSITLIFSYGIVLYRQRIIEDKSEKQK